MQYFHNAMPIAVIPMAPLVRKNVRFPCLPASLAGHRLLTPGARPCTVGKGLRSGIGLFAMRDQSSFSLQVVASFWQEDPCDQEQKRQMHVCLLVRRAMKCSPIAKLILIFAVFSIDAQDFLFRFEGDVSCWCHTCRVSLRSYYGGAARAAYPGKRRKRTDKPHFLPHQTQATHETLMLTHDMTLRTSITEILEQYGQWLLFTVSLAATCMF